MLQLVLIVLLLLFATTLFFVYLFHYFRTNYSNESAEAQGKADRIGDLTEMARLLEKGGTDNARLVVEQLLYRKPKGRTAADILALRLRAFFELKEFHNALHVGLQLSSQFHHSRFLSDIELLEYMAILYATLGHHERAYNEYLILMQRRPENIEYIFNAASHALEMKHFETGISLFGRVLQMQPDHVESLVKLGRTFCEKRLYSQALDYLNRAYTLNCDSNELRYYLALTLVQTSGKDTTALFLLQRVSQDPDWAKQALPRLIRLAAELEQHQQLVEAAERYNSLFAAETGEGLLSEILFLEANSYRYLHQMEKACELWAGISLENAYYREAQDKLAMFQPFTEAGVFQNYISCEEPKDFVDLCTKICDHILKTRALKTMYALEGHVLKAMPNIAQNSPETTQNQGLPVPAGALIVQNFRGHWIPGQGANTGRLRNHAPSYHIFLLLDQEFSDDDLQMNLKPLTVLGHDDYDRLINIHIYSFHHVSQASFGHTINYNVYIHEPSELQLNILEFQRQHSNSPNKNRQQKTATAKARSTNDTSEESS